MNIQNIFFRKARILKKKIYPMRDIVVLRDVLLGELIPRLDSDSYYMVHVVDENFNPMGILTEHQILNSAIQKNTSTKVEVLLKDNPYITEKGV